MKIELQTQKLKNLTSLIERVAGRHATLPVLSCVCIEMKKNVAVFKTTNLDIGFEVSLPVKSTGEGIVAVPAHVFSSFISQLSEHDSITTLEVVSGNLLVATAKSQGLIKTVSAEDFPTIPRITDGQEFSLPAELLVKGFKSVWYSASISNIKPELSSVYVYRDGDNIVFAATDSFRLAEKRVKAPASFKLNEVLIPFKNVVDIIRLLESIEGAVKVKVSKNLISFEDGSTYAVSRVIDGIFPDYRQIIPKGFVSEVIVLKQDILNSLKISNIFSDKFNQVHVTVDPKKKLFEIQTKNSDIGENKTTIDAAVSGERIEINFNYKYISDCFQSIDADSVSLQLSGLNKPMLIKPVSGDQTFMYVVMPMNR